MLDFLAAEQAQPNADELFRGSFGQAGPLGLAGLERYLRGGATHIEEPIGCPMVLLMRRKAVHEIVDCNPPKQAFLFSADNAYTRSTGPLSRGRIHSESGMCTEERACGFDNSTLLVYCQQSHTGGSKKEYRSFVMERGWYYPGSMRE